MSDPPQLYRAKARRALDEAKLLLAGGHTEGACSRAYYAMFDAAHAALWKAGVETAGNVTKTHNGLLALFGRELVQTGRLDASLGKSLSAVQTFRRIADYEGDPPSVSDTNEALRLAEAFVAAIEAAFFPTAPER